MARDGLVVTSQTLWDQIEQLAWLVESAMPRLLTYVLGHPVVGGDETSWELMGKKAGQGKSWYVWVLRTPDAVYYAIRGSRGAATAKELLATFSGTLMCDGYVAYLSLAAQYPLVVLAHCWAHVRREFVEIEKSFPTACGEILHLIGELYVHRAALPRGPHRRRAPRRAPRHRVTQRDRADHGVVLPDGADLLARERLAQGARLHGPHVEGPRALPRQPAHSPRQQRHRTRRTRARPRRKNHYGSRSLRGTEVAALLYSLVESAKLNDLEPRFYLRVAVRAGLRHEPVPLPHEVKAMLAEGKLEPADYDNHTEGIVYAAIAAAHAAARAGPSAFESADGARREDAAAASMSA